MLPAKKVASSIDYALDIISLSKRFKKSESRSGYASIKSVLIEQLFNKKQQRYKFKQALSHITLRVPKGSSLGIIGRNGAGKSTLLKCLTGIYKPDSGQLDINGRVSALIELGAGFHPDFTGRENLYLSAIMYGLKKSEIKNRFDQIVKFAELENVIDEPVRTYSSGMFMRLGFSIAIHVDPDILLIDEVLSVGDAGFVNKCKDKLDSLKESGKTLLIVSHDLEAVQRWCDEVVWLHEGKLKDRGEPRRVIDHYLQFIERGEEAELFTHPNLESKSADQLLNNNIKIERWGSREVEIVSTKIKNVNNEEALLFHPNDSLNVEIKYKVNEQQNDLVFGIGINRNDGLNIYGTNSHLEKIKFDNLGQSGVINFNIKRIGLLSGEYQLDVAIHKADGYPYDYKKNAVTFKVRDRLNQLGVFEPEHSWEQKIA